MNTSHIFYLHTVKFQTAPLGTISNDVRETSKRAVSVLKSSWYGEVPLPTNISQSVVDYLQELKLKMEQATERVKIFAEWKQQSYADSFNRNTTSKSFRPGDQVYLLIPDSSNKLYARWISPGEIIKHISPHSYLVKLPDGRKKQIHVNKIRKLKMRVNTVGVIFENEEEFGEIIVPEKDYLLPGNWKWIVK
ncbi:hypothetical protein AVEN_202389-1 [Araneus ventricosus]|uniref:Uncharacterized protein n=1 Tax=Araneus ventricosus TaxID=182803 RepID=A0A4Y2IY14_ARAVE|nr:hypothetical protein AVEN_202389-1 [Araneus ventricosus]